MFNNQPSTMGVEMKVNELRGIVLTNREAHKAAFVVALTGYQKMAQDKLDEQLAAARKGLTQNLYLHLTCPEDHTADYNRIIAMLSFEVRDTLQLSQADFARYVQDDWDWKQAWQVGNAGYTAYALGQ